MAFCHSLTLRVEDRQYTISMQLSSQRMYHLITVTGFLVTVKPTFAAAQLCYSNIKD